MAIKGSVFGATLLIAGCCIGAGMLGLPVVAASTGFQPNLLMFIATWLFMMATGLLLLEINLSIKEKTNLLTIAEITLGTVGKALTWILFLFLFYSLMVSYISGSGLLLKEWAQAGLDFSLPKWAGEMVISLIFGIMIYLGTVAVDWTNRLFMVGLGVTYFLLIVIGLPHVQTDRLTESNWNISLLALPVMVVSFGYHNLIPTVVRYLGNDKKRICYSLILGSTIPLFAYLLWDFVILGLMNPTGAGLQGEEMATKALHAVSGLPWVGVVADFFAFFAIVTSFLGVALSLVDFLADGFHQKKLAISRKVLAAITVLPPLIFSLVNPCLFITALSYAGFAAVILFGVLPVAMVWVGRYQKKIIDEHVFPFGKLGLCMILAFALLVMATQMYHKFTTIRG